MKNSKIKQQDHMFVAWSKGIQVDTFDVKAIADFLPKKNTIQVLDIGGGIGSFVKALKEVYSGKIEAAVLDISPLSQEHFVQDKNIHFMLGNFLEDTRLIPVFDAIVLRTVLHHFIASTDTATYKAQSKALVKAKSLLAPNGCVYVVENFYQPFFGKDSTGSLIYRLTSLGGGLSRLFRRLGANTAGEGVRFRSVEAWQGMMQSAGFEVIHRVVNANWTGPMPWWQKLPLLCRGRHQALWVLKPITT
jgi:SAM-dependent methyltransferase